MPCPSRQLEVLSKDMASPVPTVINMKSPQNFDREALRAPMAPVLAALNAERENQLAQCQNAALWCGVLGVSSGAIVALAAPSPLWGLAPAILALVIYIWMASSAQNSYTTGFKTLAMPTIVAAFGDLKFDGAAGLDESDFNFCNLHPNPDRFESEDLIYGSVGATQIRCSEVHAEERRTRTDSKGRTETHYVTIFRGLLFVADFPKHFVGQTFLVPEGLSGALGNFGAGLQNLGGKMSGRGELVRLESPDFERVFIATSTDQTEARYLLSSSLMERFLTLKNRFGGEISAAFINESLYLTIAKTNDWFEPPTLSQPLSFEALETVFSQLQMTLGIVENLDLNTRIWSKT